MDDKGDISRDDEAEGAYEARRYCSNDEANGLIDEIYV